MRQWLKLTIFAKKRVLNMSLQSEVIFFPYVYLVVFYKSLMHFS